MNIPAGVNQDIYLYITSVYDNNAQALYPILEDNGIQIRNLNRADSINNLYNRWVANPSLMLSIFKQVPYDAQADNYTSSPQFVAALQSDIQRSGKQPSRSTTDWWSQLGDLVGGSTATTATTVTNTPTASGSSATNVVIVVVIVAAIIGAIYFFTKTK